MVRRRGAAAAGLLACLLMLHLLVPGLVGDPRASVAVTAAELAQPDAPATDTAERAEEPCPCEEGPSIRQFAARTPRAAGAAGVSAVVAGAPRVDRGAGVPAAAERCPVAGGAVPDSVELRVFRC